MKKLLIFALFFSVSAHAQSIVGKWKRTASVIEYTNGKTKDLQETMNKILPCSKDIQYIFESSGKHFTIIPKDCISVAIPDAVWKMEGNTLFISQKVGKEMMSTTFELSFSGNQMTMTHVYSASENQPKNKEMSITYVKL